jgi:hypothetical protein
VAEELAGGVGKGCVGPDWVGGGHSKNYTGKRIRPGEWA